MDDHNGYDFRPFTIPSESKTTHETWNAPEMAPNWTLNVISWFWRVFYLLRSLSVYWKPRPELPMSASNIELENGLFYKMVANSSREHFHPSKTHHETDHTSASPKSFQFHFQEPTRSTSDTSQRSTESQRQEFLAHPSPRATPRSPRRKRSRESAERRRQRRNGQFLNFNPPPEIYIEDWSESLSEMQPKAVPIGPHLDMKHGYPPPSPTVPCVIITPSTPSEENTSRFTLHPNSPFVIAKSPLNSPPPTSSPVLQSSPPVGDSSSTVVALPSPLDSPPSSEIYCNHTAEIVMQSSEDSGGSENAKETSQQQRGFAFSDSLADIVFKALMASNEGSTTVELSSVPHVTAADPFQPPHMSTPRLGSDSSSPDMTLGSLIYDDSLPVNTPGSSSQRRSALPYPEVFDLDMYAADVRASMAAFGTLPNYDDTQDRSIPTHLPSPPYYLHSPTQPPTLGRFSFALPPPPKASTDSNANDSPVVPIDTPVIPGTNQHGSKANKSRDADSPVWWAGTRKSNASRFSRLQLPPPPAIPESPDVFSDHRLSDSVGNLLYDDETDPSISMVRTREIQDGDVVDGSTGSNTTLTDHVGHDSERPRVHYRHRAISRLLSHGDLGSGLLEPSPSSDSSSSDHHVSPTLNKSKRNSSVTLGMFPPTETVGGDNSVTDGSSKTKVLRKKPPANPTVLRAESSGSASSRERAQASRSLRRRPPMKPMYRVPRSISLPLRAVNKELNSGRPFDTSQDQPGPKGKGNSSLSSIMRLRLIRPTKQKSGMKENISLASLKSVGGLLSGSTGAGERIGGLSGSVVRRIATLKARNQGHKDGSNSAEPEVGLGGKALHLLKEVNRMEELRKLGVYSTGVGDNTLNSMMTAADVDSDYGGVFLDRAIRAVNGSGTRRYGIGRPDSGHVGKPDWASEPPTPVRRLAKL